MSNNYYSHGSFPSTGSAATSASMRAELDLVTAGFDKLPTLTSNANKFVVVNGTSTGLTTTSDLPTSTATDTSFTIQNATDNTKTFQFLASAITAGTLRVYTMPDVSTTLVGTTATQTLTNKTLTAPIFSTIVNTGVLTLPTSTDTLVGRATTDTLTNKTLTAPIFSTIVNTGVLTLPTSTDTLVGRATTDTLTNKTLGAVTLSGTVSGGGNQINNVIIGSTTPLAGAFTTLSASSTVSGTGFSTYLASPPAIGGTAAAAGAFTTLSASSTVSGTGFSTYLASPPAIGGTAAAAGAFTTLSASSTVSGTGFSTYLASPPAIGGTAAAAGSFTTLTTSSTVTLNGGTANGVAYLNGSKVLTTGTALTFDGTNLGIGRTPVVSLDVQATTSAIIRTRSGATYGSGFFATLPNSDTSMFALSDKSNTSGGTAGQVVSLYTNSLPLVFEIGTEKMRLDASGNLGIGTSSPAYKLDVAGTIRAVGTAATIFNSFYSTGTTTAANYGAITNTGNTLLWGVDSSTGSAITGSTAYASFVGSSSAYPLEFITTGTVRATLDISGNLGLGVTPSAWSSASRVLDVGNGAQTDGSFVSGFYALTVARNAYYDGTNWKAKYTATEKPTKFTQPYAGGFVWSIATGSVTANTAFTFSDAMTLDASGNFVVGFTTAGAYDANNFSYSPAIKAIDVNHATGSASGSLYARFNYAGTTIGSITQSGTTAVLYNLTSDRRLKENIQDAAPASALIDAIQVRQYDWKSDGSHQRYGFVAQELVTVAPEAVHQPADPEEMMAVDYSKLVPMLVKEIQDLRKRLATLESKA